MSARTTGAFIECAAGETPYAPIPDGAFVHIDAPLLGLSQWGTVRGGPLDGYDPGLIVHAVQTDTGPTVFVLRTHLTDVRGIYAAAPAPRVRDLATYHLPPRTPL